MNSRSPWLWLTVVMLLATGYYLWPTVKASRMTAQELAANPEERALKLGLDLRGGMAVTMEVRVDELIRALATNTDAAFDRALQTATNEAKTSTASMVSLFVNAYEEQNPQGRLARYFRSDVDRITRNSSNADVSAYLEAQADGAVNRAIEIVRQRIDRFGVSEPSIVKKGTSRISVDLAGVDDDDAPDGRGGFGRREVRQVLRTRLQKRLHVQHSLPGFLALEDQFHAKMVRRRERANRALTIDDQAHRRRLHTPGRQLRPRRVGQCRAGGVADDPIQ